MSEKTEAPSPRRIRSARERGYVPCSAYASQAVAFCVAVALGPAALDSMLERAEALMRASLKPDACPLGAGIVIREILQLSVPLLGAVAATSIAVTLLQTGGSFELRRIAPHAAPLAFPANITSVFRLSRLWTAARVMLAAAAIGVVLVASLWRHSATFARTAGRPDAALAVAGCAAHQVASRVAAIGLALAVVDLLVHRAAYFHGLKMSRSEIQRERRDAEGDPRARDARRQNHHELVLMATTSAVHDATVVVTAPPHVARALRYVNGRDDAPVVVAYGDGAAGRRIEDAARLQGIPIVNEPSIVRGLAGLEIGDPIPEALYESVAKVLRDVDLHAQASRSATSS